ncbi:hypothetical protein F4677DRAFT_451765 [Hypoxylon crocopeplum]|nr:hypothetical protein F4677DRAFT_451765 [Hypoxylon crocopeplum]
MSETDLISNITTVINSMNHSLEYANTFYRSLTNQSRLNVSAETIHDGAFEAAGLGYVKWLQDNVNLGWFVYQVSRIPCVYGWAELANNLSETPNVDTASMFYSEWIQANLDWSYGADHSEMLENEVQYHNNSETFMVYNKLFREGMLFEIAFFESAIGRELPVA